MKKTFFLILIALSVALISVLSQFTIPFGPIPITLQTLIIGILATILRPRDVFFSVSLYVLIGIIGFPVFAGGTGGIQHFVGPTIGFLIFFPFRALITSLMTRSTSSIHVIFLANLIGSLLLFVSGALGFAFYTKVGLPAAFTTVVLPFILPDTIKLIIITLVSKAIFTSLKNHWYFRT